LLFQLPSHIIGLLPQIPDCPKHAVELLVLFLHHLLLSLMLHLRIVISILLSIQQVVKMRWTWQGSAHSAGSPSGNLSRWSFLHCSLQLVSHRLDLPPDIVNELDAKAIGINLDGAHAFNEVS
jgi:hypothetical protein